MSIHDKEVTSPGDFGPPGDGDVRAVVPDSPSSLSNDGQGREGARGGTRGRLKTYSPPLRLRGGGEEEGAGSGKGPEKEEGRSRSASASRSCVGPGSQGGGARPARGKQTCRRGRDWRLGRNIPARCRDSTSSEEDEKKNEEETEGEEEWKAEKEDLTPTVAREIQEITTRARETARRAVERTKSPRIGPRVTADIPLEGKDRVVLEAPNLKRRKMDVDEDGDTGMEAEGESEERRRVSSPSPADQNRARPGSASSSASRKRGRPSTREGQEGQHTAEKRREREKIREQEKIAEKEAKIADPAVKATTARAEAADRNALRLLDVLREAPTPELTDAGLREVEVIKKVASTSTNMSGAFVGQLWKAAEKLLALNLIFSERIRSLSTGEGKESSEEIEHLRADVASVRTENAILRGQVRDLREQVAKGTVTAQDQVAPVKKPKSPPVARRKRKGGKAVQVLSDSPLSSGEEESWTGSCPWKWTEPSLPHLGKRVSRPGWS